MIWVSCSADFRKISTSLLFEKKNNGKEQKKIEIKRFSFS